jgi:hypothetical protein
MPKVACKKKSAEHSHVFDMPYYYTKTEVYYSQRIARKGSTFASVTQTSISLHTAPDF